MTARFATTASQRISWRWEGEAFGETTDQGLQTEVNLRFPGQYFDGETGEHYNWHRYYDPKLGRYLTSDRLGLLDGPNTYAYAYQNPLGYTDPTGQIVPLLIYAYIALEVGLTLWDIYDTYDTFTDECSSTGDKLLAGGLLAAGVVLPGNVGWADNVAKSTDIKVLGRLEDTKVARDWEGHDVLNIPDWTLKKNDQWVQQGIKNKQDFYTASPEEGNLRDAVTKRKTVYGRELKQIKEAGYVKQGDYYIHPDNL